MLELSGATRRGRLQTVLSRAGPDPIPHGSGGPGINRAYRPDLAGTRNSRDVAPYRSGFAKARFIRFPQRTTNPISTTGTYFRAVAWLPGKCRSRRSRIEFRS